MEPVHLFELLIKRKQTSMRVSGACTSLLNEIRLICSKEAASIEALHSFLKGSKPQFKLPLFQAAFCAPLPSNKKIDLAGALQCDRMRSSNPHG